MTTSENMLGNTDDWRNGGGRVVGLAGHAPVVFAISAGAHGAVGLRMGTPWATADAAITDGSSGRSCQW